MSNSKETKHVTETPDTSHIKNIDVTHEVRDVYIGGIMKFVIALAILMVVSFVLMWALFRSLQSRSVEPPPSPMALSEKDRLPPEPRLQSAPGFAEELEKSAQKSSQKERAEAPAMVAKAPAPKGPTWEIKVLREEWDDVLKNGPIDQDGHRYGMPIDKAKEEVLKQLMESQKAESRKQ